jgi:hypothetical protein
MSPLKMLGYSVNAKDGLPDKEREEFLIDFCESALLPINLPAAYAERWGKPNTKLRVLRTAKHLGFLKKISNVKTENDLPDLFPAGAAILIYSKNATANF